LKTKTIISIILGGGLIVLLFLLTTFKPIVYLDENFNIEIKREILEFQIKSKELPVGITLDYEIEEVLFGDFTNDGIENVAVYLWKKGNYGEKMPFWVKENDKSYKQHLFLYEKTGENKYKSIWNSSNLPYINKKTILADIDKDGLNEIAVIEQPYNAPYKNIAVWQWDDWGFENIWRSESGNFSDLKLK